VISVLASPQAGRWDRIIIRRALLCLPLLTATALPTTAERRPGRDGLFSTSMPSDFVLRPPRSIPNVEEPRPGSAAAKSGRAARSGPAAPAKASSRAAGLAVSPDFPPAQTLDTITEAMKGWYGFP
jgi:hypothetical protein